jgi:hypothetical protein
LQQALALVQAHAARAAHRLVQPLGGQVLLVLGVAGLVQHAHERLGEVGLVVAGGDAHVARDAAAEGVVAGVQAAVVEVEAHLLMTSRPSQRWRSTGKGPSGTTTFSLRWRSSAAWMKPGRKARRSANRTSMAALRAPGSKPSRRAS